MNLIRPGMGTENCLAIITAIIKMIRPKTSLEIGAGDSTVAIANALVESFEEYTKDQNIIKNPEWSERVELLMTSPENVLDKYEPTFISVDNHSADGCSASEAWKVVKGRHYSSINIETFNTDFYELSTEFYTQYSGFDFIWLDAGTFLDDVRFISKLWQYLKPGGILLIHEPYMSSIVEGNKEQSIAMVRTPLWEFIIKSELINVDIISIPETHKYRQTSVGILRKYHQWETNRNDTFQNEMINIDEPPIRFSLTKFLDNKRCKLKKVSDLGILTNSLYRKVLYAIGVGNVSIQDISLTLNMKKEIVSKSVAKLLDHNLICYIDGKLTENNNFWCSFQNKPNINQFRELSDVQLEEEVILDLIVAYLDSNQEYSEKYISEYCYCFTDDYARLRRKLIDTGRLIRVNNIYTKSK